MSELITSISGVRGIVGDSLTPDVIMGFAQAFARFCGGGSIAVGYDGRPSGAAIRDLVVATLALAGVSVIDLGMVPTPTVQLAVEESDAVGGIAITASHNPSEWNGLKFIDETGVFLDHERNAALMAIRSNPVPMHAAWDGVGRICREHAFVHRHVDAVCDIAGIDYAAVQRRGFTVVVDAVNASGSIVVPMLLERLGCRVIPVYCSGDGMFPHTPEPLPDNLVLLGEAVREHHADLGVAVDPDADRLVLFDEQGRPFGEEYTITSAIDGLFRGRSGAGKRIVVNLSTTRAIEDLARRHGATVERAPVGEINVVSRMRSTGAIAGGEGSGGVILPEVHEGRDSLVGIVLVLNALAGFDGPASDYRASLPEYVIRKFRYALGDVDPGDALANVRTAFQDLPHNTQDGIRIEFADGWVHLRRSNTEPIVRLIAEAPTFDAAGALAERVATAAFPGTR